MSDLVQADQVLSDGEVDFNVEQHTAYMKNFNEKQNGHLVSVDSNSNGASRYL